MSALRTLPGVSKVPEITAVFWVTKVLTTGMGETTSDFLLTTLDPVPTVLVTAAVFVIALVAQFRTGRYVPWVYWLTVVMVSIFGTMVADVLHVIIGVPYEVSTVFFALVLAALFVAWRRTQKTLSIHEITTRPRETFYWATVLATFALGTAAGDLTATVFDLGYFGSGILFAVLIVLPALAYRLLGLNAVFAFWFAYVVTRPLGASFADWVAVAPARGGLALGTGPVSLVMLVVIVVLVGALSLHRPALSRQPAPAAYPTSPARRRGAAR